MPQLPVLSSFTVKIFILLIFVGGVPVVSCALLFDWIMEFNQNLQVEAEKSIDDVTNVYKAWSAGVKTSHNALRVMIRSDVERIFRENGVDSTERLTGSEAVKSQLKTSFERQLRDKLVFDIEMKVDQKEFLRVSSNRDTTGFTTDSMYSLVAFSPDEVSRTPEADALLQQDGQVVLDATEEITGNTDADAPSLPARLPEHSRPKMFNAPVELTITVGYDQNITEVYERLGEKRNIHGSIMALENSEDTQMASLYRRFILSICALVSVLCIMAAIIIVYPLSKRISILANATRRVADGDLETQVEVRGNDQIAFLTRQFNSMISDLKSAQDNRAYIERMQAWQEVARRLAHEIKNPLTPMLLAMQQLDKKFSDYENNPKKYRRILDEVMEIMNEEAATLQKLVKEFSSFARLPVPDRKPEKFFTFVEQTVQQNPQFEEACKRCEVHRPDETIQQLVASIDRELMRRVIVNIVKNGIEAAQNAHIEPEIDLDVLQKNDEKTSKQTIWLRVVDNGPGLTAEQKEKIFNPYFTTKSDGTGLGLVIVRKIVQDHDGEISLHDRDDGQRGTQVDIILYV